MNRDQPHHEPDKLRRLLRAYLLSSDFSLLKTEIEHIIKVYRAGLKVRMWCCPGSLRNQFEEVLTALAIPFTITAHPAERPRWVTDRRRNVNPQIVRIWVPEASERFTDFGVMIPYYMEKALDRLHRSDKSTAMPMIDVLYLMYLRVVTTSPFNQDIENRIYRDMVDSVGTNLLDYDHRDSSDLYYSLQISAQWPVGLMYIGIDPGNGWCDDIQIQPGLENHPLNLIAKELSISRKLLRYRLVTIVRLKSQMHKSVGEIATMAHNLRLLEIRYSQNPSVANKVLKCLKLRMAGKSESEICKALRYSSQGNYEAWLKKECIDFTPIDSHAIYEEGKEARDWLLKTTDRPSETLSVQARSEPPLSEHYSVNKSGDILEIIFDGRKLPPLAWSKRTNFLPVLHLLNNPHKEFKSTQLDEAVGGTAVHSQGEVYEHGLSVSNQIAKDDIIDIDEKSRGKKENLKTHYRQEFNSIEQKIQKAKEMGKIEEEELLDRQKEMLHKRMKRDFTPKGELRQDNSTEEKVRKKLRSQIDRANKHIQKEIDVEFFQHLNKYILYNDGYWSYRPPINENIVWHIDKSI